MPKKAYRKPTVVGIAQRIEAREVTTKIQLLELQLSVLRSQQRAIFHSLDGAQQQLVMAYEEE